MLAIQEIGTQASQALPATTFTYAPKGHTNTPNCYVYSRLVGIDNGLGGRTEFSYGHDHRQSPGWAGPIPSYGRSFFVTEQRVYDGIHASPTIQPFTPATPCYDQYDGNLGDLPAAFNCPRHTQAYRLQLWAPRAGRFRHHGQYVSLLGYDGQQLQRQRYTFHQDRRRSGQFRLLDSFAADGFHTHRSERLYTTDAADITGNGRNDFDFTYVQRESETRFVRGGQSSSTVTIHTYDRQNNRQFGNETAVRRIARLGGQAEQQLLVTRDYFPNETNWVVTLVARERTYDGLELIGETRTGYDQRNWSQPPLMGQVTHLEQRIAAGQYRSEQLVYDSFANPTQLIDPLGNATQTTFDPIYHLYPLVTINAAGHTIQSSYCGVDIVCDVGEPAGSLRRQIDPNGTAAYYRYDSLGRLIARYRSEAEFLAGHPIETHSYHLNVAGPTYSTQWQRTQNSAVGWSLGGTWQREFVDGLGRPIQRQRPYTDWWSAGKLTGQRIVTDMAYNGLGQVVRQSAPYLAAAAGEHDPLYLNPSQTVNYQSSRFDSSGKPVRQIGLDGAVNTTLYGLNHVYYLDPARHLRVAHQDDIGQLIGVDEALEPFRDEFDNNNLPGWNRQGNVTITGGAVRLAGNGSWNTSLGRSLQAGPDWGVQFSFRGSHGQQEFYFFNDSGTPGQTDFYRWALQINNGAIQLLHIAGNQSQLSSLLPYVAGQTYRVLMRGEADSGEFAVLVWREDKPEEVAEILLTQPAKSRREDWQFLALNRTNGSTLWLNDYSELAFSRTRYELDLKGQLTRVIDAAGNETTILYDQLGRKDPAVRSGHGPLAIWL